MAQRRKSYLWVGALTCFVLAIVGFWVLLTPNNPITRLFEVSISDSNGPVITGPYPVTADFRLLHEHGVTTVVSLLDPRIPYENVLLQKERRHAAKFGMKLVDYPMTSVLGHHNDSFGSNAERAAVAIDSIVRHGSSGKIYLHCYLGLHRTVAVRDLLAAKGTTTGNYTVREAYRSQQAGEFDEAIAQYREGNLVGAIRTVSAMKQPDVPALLIRGWSNYRLHNVDLAKSDFSAAFTASPDMTDAENGLAYCYLAKGQLDSARVHFTHVAKNDRDNPQAQSGLALVEYRSGNRDAARQYVTMSLSLDSTNTEARDLLAHINANGAR
jgi:tetratricopeptide (TPR) repeat protein